MISFLDNTAIHRAGLVIESSRCEDFVRPVDAISMLHVAGHIMFSDKILISAFELDKIRNRTRNVRKILEKRSVVPDNNFIVQKGFSKNDYAVACEEASERIRADLRKLSSDAIRRSAELADEATRPTDAGSSPLGKWISNESYPKSINKYKESALDRKAAGSFDYTVSSNKSLRKKLREAGSEVELDKKRLARLLEVYLRYWINSEIANNINATYSPAPQRAKAINSANSIFRYEVCRKIINIAKSSEEGLSIPIVEEIYENESIPIPVLAINALAEEEPSSPLEMIECASRLRDDGRIKRLRKWINKWEERQDSNTSYFWRDKESEISEIKRDLDAYSEDVKWNSLLTGAVKLWFNDYENVDMFVNEAIMRKILKELSRPKSFLTFVRRPRVYIDDTRKRLTNDSSMAYKIGKMINCPISDV